MKECSEVINKKDEEILDIKERIVMTKLEDLKIPEDKRDDPEFVKMYRYYS